jgi:hypothetical protein
MNRVDFIRENKHWIEVANANLDKHLGDVIDVDETDPETLYEETVVLVSDALVDAGCPTKLISTIVTILCEPYKP